MELNDAPLAVVTGAASGIGRASAIRLGRDGYRVCGVDRDGAGLELTGSLLARGSFSSHLVDLVDVASIEHTIREIVGDIGDVSLLVNNAGIGFRADVLGTSVAEWELTLAVNLSATFHMSRLLLPNMVEQGHGVIVNVASYGAVVGVAMRAAYCASKAGVVGLTRAIAVDHASEGIRCNVICPGTVATEWIDRIVADAPNPLEMRAGMANRQLDGRMGTPQEVAAGIAFLASPDARFVNGAVFMMDGGASAV